jgi:hypothetical protein
MDGALDAAVCCPWLVIFLDGRWGHGIDET